MDRGIRGRLVNALLRSAFHVLTCGGRQRKRLFAANESDAVSCLKLQVAGLSPRRSGLSATTIIAGILASSGLLPDVRWFKTDVSALHIGAIVKDQAIFTA